MSLDDAKDLVASGRLAEAERLLDAELARAEPLNQARIASAAGRIFQKAGQPELAARWFARAAGLDPRDPEHPHDRGLCLLEAGDVGLAAQAQAEALRLDPEHVGA